jgi:hypothetical protein
MCGIVTVLCLSVIKSGCNRSENKIQSSELEPVISSRVPRRRHNILVYVYYNRHQCEQA